MLVHSLWDQEDIYGDIAVFKALNRRTRDSGQVSWMMGPWHHDKRLTTVRHLAALKFNSDTASPSVRKY